jgi:hypothetical protein
VHDTRRDLAVEAFGRNLLGGHASNAGAVEKIQQLGPGSPLAPAEDESAQHATPSAKSLANRVDAQQQLALGRYPLPARPLSRASVHAVLR